MFLKNTWYVACTAADLNDTRPLGRTICGEAIAFFRGPDGRAAAVEDFCPHRGAPLSLGKVCNGLLTCGYHGLQLGCDGRTVAMPGQRVQHFPAIRRYPVEERHGFIWVWPGAADQADPGALPQLDWLDHPEWAFGGGMYHIACDHRLMIDNLMDLSHETHVHSTSIGQPEIDETPAKTRVEGDQVITSRYMSDIPAPPFWRMALRGAGLADDVPVDRWQVCRFTPPSHIMIDVGVAHAGLGGIDAPADRKVSAIVVDFLTPETETTMWYFWGMARHFQPQDTALTDAIREGQRKIFGEDLEMLERQQRNLSIWPDRRLMTLNIDAGGVHSRRVLERLIAREAAGA